MKITVGKYAGYCFGVGRAVELAIKGAEEHGSVYCAGELIHNRRVLSELAEKNVYTCTGAEEIPPGQAAVIRAHGLSLEDIEILRKKNCTVIDATCPYVKKIHEIVLKESEKNRFIVIFGKKGHPEVAGILSRCTNAAVVGQVEDLEDLAREILPFNGISVVCQTTFGVKNANNMLKVLKNTCKTTDSFDTICMATFNSQTEAKSMASVSDGVVVIGDPKSSNTNNLYSICKDVCSNTVFVESAEQVEKATFRNCKNVFITAGTSTPHRILEEVVATMADEIMNNSGDQSFEEMLEQSFKTLHTGEKVTGIVTQITETEVTVDLGVKQSGYIPLNELSDDPLYNVKEEVQVGDDIEAFVVRVNDVEGWIMLSKKRLDAVKHWETIENAVESREILDGTVIDQNKGGIVVLVKGIRVFVPASQTGLPREASFDSMMKTTHKLRITEVNRQRRRVVGSIKDVVMETRREAQTKIWATIAVGDKFKGIVKSFTSYGAFVDIGGVDGMIHISELSWSKVNHPSDVLKIGQEIDVYVIGLDSEKRKISLGYKNQLENPWTTFETRYNIGDTVNVKIVKFMTFGAFAEVVPGVDGLIHISQISPDKRINKVEDALTIGQQVEVKIVDIDSENKKISLSIRALLDPMYDMPDSDEEPVQEKDEVVYETPVTSPEEAAARVTAPEESEAPVAEEAQVAEEPPVEAQ